MNHFQVETKPSSKNDRKKKSNNIFPGSGSEQSTRKSQKVTDIDSMISTQMDLSTDALATKSENESVSQYSTSNLSARHHLLQIAIN